SAIGVRIDAAAALVTKLVMIVVVAANTTTTKNRLPEAIRSIVRASRSASPLSTTMAASPTEPARMNRTVQSSARAADLRVSTPARTMDRSTCRAARATRGRADRRRHDTRHHDGKRRSGLAWLRGPPGGVRPHREGVVSGKSLVAGAGHVNGSAR